MKVNKKIYPIKENDVFKVLSDVYEPDERIVQLVYEALNGFEEENND